jgi:hypothetical protein
MSTNLSPTGGCFAQGEDFRHQRAGAADANEWELDCLLLHSHELKPSRVDSLALPPFEAVCRPSKKSLKMSDDQDQKIPTENEIIFLCFLGSCAHQCAHPPSRCVVCVRDEFGAARRVRVRSAATPVCPV